MQTLAILLATYNGEKYLAEQLDSLFAQSNADWRLVIRDDGSSDNTLDILQAYQRRYPDRIQLLDSQRRNLGATACFGELLLHTAADTLMFCDQDDLWQPMKIERTLQRMKALEEERGQQTPLLVHSDLRVMDRSLHIINSSFWHYEKLNARRGDSLVNLVVQNVVTGCTMMINRALRDLAIHLPPKAILHDWWLALVAAAFGKIAAISEPLTDYRQHGRNEVGAKAWGVEYFLDRARNPRDVRRRLRATQTQAGEFARRYHDRLPPRTYEKLWGYANLSQRSFIARRAFLLRHGFLKSGLLRNLGLMLWI